ncbi:TetR/AcrR family transcriptional regulator [Nocardioides marmoriginsengisoli]|uniref:TetR/AcrR family transcriptional regulator n=1 Tax=Nocardioides marmoriginsengisoli TaxID=661483 RepID=A0A3N0CQN6_9ACTN|nr:TetR/AcrR family transcriptional regulator [Nocardioides marmoriginsengisoli]RNL65336.1 TetR/AcrR family transcriptional regulator [Nocardioides marmoriginsengisoli]
MTEESWDRLVDRRGANRGDARRDALLTAFDELLREKSLEEVNVAEISGRAGVTRSAFYFYFESKAVAVLALMRDLYDAAADANELLMKAEGDPETRIRTAITMLFDSVDSSPHTYRALLEARAASVAVRQLWDAGRADFARLIGGMIATERAAGRATDGTEPDALASVLLDLNDYAVERHSLGSGPPRDQHIEALTFLWLRTIYGENP